MAHAKMKRYGNQKPRIDIYENGDIWLADKTIRLVESYGMKLLPWQKNVLYRWMALNEDGTWANPDCGLEVPRQNGKTELFLVRIIGGMVFLHEALIYTAQSDNTVATIKTRLQRFFYDAKDEIRNMLTDEFDKEPKSLDYVELRNRGRVVFRTRTRTNGLGATNDTLLIDEAQEETDAQNEALLPTISAGKNQNQQTIRAGTPPSGGGSGTVFIRKRRNVLEGKVTDVCWQEWSVENITDPNDVDAWYAANPSLGYHLLLSAVKKEAGEMAIDSFNKMRLGWIAGVESQRAFTDDQWLPLATESVVLPENAPFVYTIKFAPDGSATTLCVGVLMDYGVVHVEVIERKPRSAGISWITRWLFQGNRWRKAKKIIIDGASGTQLLVEELVRSERRISKRILTPNVKQAGAAYAAFNDAIENKLVTHSNQPGLNVSMKTVKRRDIGRDGMYGYASMNPDIQSDPVEAAAFACWGAVAFAKEKTGDGTTSQEIML